MAKRSRLDIITDMLHAIMEKNSEIKPTHLMYKSNLSHTQLNSYLEELIDKNLVNRTTKNDYEYIIITDKGRHFLQKLMEMREFEKTFGI